MAPGGHAGLVVTASAKQLQPAGHCAAVAHMSCLATHWNCPVGCGEQSGAGTGSGAGVASLGAPPAGAGSAPPGVGPAELPEPAVAQPVICSSQVKPSPQSLAALHGNRYFGVHILTVLGSQLLAPQPQSGVFGAHAQSDTAHA